MHNLISRLSAGLLLVCLLSGCEQDEQTPELAQYLPASPGMNVLVISFDALRADALGAYGNQRALSPNLDRFASEAVVFENAYTAAPVTPTSFAAAFTGQWPFRVFHGWKLVVQKTLAEMLNENGYHTFGIFNNPQVASERFFGRGFDHYDVVYLPDEGVLTAATDYLDTLPEQPFFGWVHFISPHSPYDYREMAAHLYDPDYQGPFLQSSGQPFSADNPADLKRLKDLYDGEVLFLDVLFDQLLSTLKEKGLLDKTVIVISSDHGEEFMEHGQMEHNAVFEELIRIPMIVRHPIAQGWRNPVPYSNVDLMPTLLSMLGIPHDLKLDGVDLTSASTANRVLLSTGMTHRFDRHFSASQVSDKLIVDCKPDYDEALYNLADDPMESVNLVRVNPNRVASLLDSASELAAGEVCSVIQNAIANKNPTANLTEEQIENLKSLGYIQ